MGITKCTETVWYKQESNTTALMVAVKEKNQSMIRDIFALPYPDLAAYVLKEDEVCTVLICFHDHNNSIWFGLQLNNVLSGQNALSLLFE